MMTKKEQRDFAEAIETTAVSLCEPFKTKEARVACFKGVETIIGEQEAWLRRKEKDSHNATYLDEAKIAVHTLRTAEERG